FAIDCSSNEVIAQLPLVAAYDVVYDSIDNKAYCTFGYVESLMVVDGHTHARMGALPLPSGIGGSTCAWSSSMDRMYVAYEDNDVLVLDCTADTVVATIRVGRGPRRPVINERHRKVYVPNIDSETISVIDMETNEVIRTIQLDDCAIHGCYSYAADKYYVGDVGDEIWVIDGEEDTVVARVDLPVGTAVTAFAAVETEALVMVATNRSGPDSIYVLDALGDSVAAAVPAGTQPRALLWSHASRSVYCVSTSGPTSGELAVVAEDGSGVRLTLPLGDYPSAMAFSPVSQRLYIGHQGTRRVYVVRDTTTGVTEPAGTPARCPQLTLRPNPFAGATVVGMPEGIPGGEGVRVFGPDGRLVRVLAATRAAGRRAECVWDGRDTAGRSVGPGVYLVVVDGDPRCCAKAIKQ
ncbi:YncE family protein, partial [candidate division WOR-3 bacterium]|nr:YncE family protein [candidate division WOR-3 bacterium]